MWHALLFFNVQSGTPATCRRLSLVVDPEVKSRTMAKGFEIYRSYYGLLDFRDTLINLGNFDIFGKFATTKKLSKPSLHAG